MLKRIARFLIAALFLFLLSTSGQASITYQSQSTGYVYGYSSVSIQPPYNVSGQTLIAVFNVLNDSQIEDSEFIIPTVTASPTDWHRIVDNGFYGIGEYRAAWYKIADSSTASISWGFDLPLRGQVSILCYGGIDTSTPINSFSFKNDWLFSTNHSTNAVTTDFANCLIIVCWFSADTGIGFFEPDSPANTRINFEGVSMQAQRAMLVADEIQVSAGSSGSKTAVTNSSSYCQNIIIALKPAS